MAKYEEYFIIKLATNLSNVKDDLGNSVSLSKGEVGTIVTVLSENAYIVEFTEGVITKALITLTNEQIEPAND